MSSALVKMCTLRGNMEISAVKRIEEKNAPVEHLLHSQEEPKYLMYWYRVRASETKQIFFFNGFFHRIRIFFDVLDEQLSLSFSGNIRLLFV